MASNKEAQRRQRRRELDARRSKFRVRLGSWPESWSKLKDQLGFSLHSELAQFLLDSYSCKVCSRCSGDGKEVISVTVASLDQLILLVHSHGQQCPLTPNLQSEPHRQEVKERALEEDPETSTRSSEAAEAELCLTYVCEGGHTFTWRPIHTQRDDNGEKSEQGSAAPSGQRKIRERRRKGVKREEEVCRMRSRRSTRGRSVSDGNTAGFRRSDETEQVTPSSSGENEEAEYLCHSDAVQHEQDAGSQEGSDAALLILPPKFSAEAEADDCQNIRDIEIQDSVESRDVVWDAIPNSTTRERERREDVPETSKTEEPRMRARRKTNRQPSQKDELLKISGRRKRKPAPKLILPCEFDGCWKIFSSRQYLNHHMKYQHFQQKTFSCSNASCGKSFNFKKHLKEHEKLHSDQRDYICEFCARAFRTSSNLSIHRRIHTGEKPLQCEVCGFTCRQKASLNWHMRKHDAERSYQFACEICGRRFEKRDNVTAHQSKSHPDHVTSDLPKEPTANDL
ncbi:zinc finger protein 692 isoform X2 [Pangasianodon hypophthalmus]|uniref:zinc finger protein 692 isoform X2 n=1 Tax=Pangasianodon hypophthalmus TaxID=310915 RepID=UPI002307DC69|nr:zinc finger protein 692 isoform X2 [Pangasianodon hypophthalmus]